MLGHCCWRQGQVNHWEGNKITNFFLKLGKHKLYKRKGRGSFSFGLILISRDITAECAWWLWSKGLFTLGSCYGITVFWKKVAVEIILRFFWHYSKMSSGLKWVETVFFCMVGEKRPRLFISWQCIERSWAAHMVVCNTIMLCPGRQKKKKKRTKGWKLSFTHQDFFEVIELRSKTFHLCWFTVRLLCNANPVKICAALFEVILNPQQCIQIL